MGTPPVSHPPTPQGATTRELQTIASLHRQATTTADQPAGSAMFAGVALLVELIQARNRRQSYTDQWDHNQAEGWAE